MEHKIGTNAFYTTLACLFSTPTSYLPTTQYFLNWSTCVQSCSMWIATMHTGERGFTNTTHEKKRTFTTSINDQNNVERTIDMLGRHLQKFAQLETVWQEFSSRNTGENWQRSDKTRGMGGQNTHNKLYSQPISLYLAYNMQPRLIYLTILPSAPLSSHCVHRCGGAHFAKTTTSDSNQLRPQPQTVINNK
jgi:hypothetical protein